MELISRVRNMGFTFTSTNIIYDLRQQKLNKQAMLKLFSISSNIFETLVES